MQSSSVTRVAQLFNNRTVPSLTNTAVRKFYDRSSFFHQKEEKATRLSTALSSLSTAFEPSSWSFSSLNRRHAVEEKPLKNVDFKQVQEFCKIAKTIEEIENQKFCPQRAADLGPDIAALHFFTYRQAAVKLKNSPQWITGSLTTLAEYLPRTYVEGCYVEAVDCSHFQPNGIRYEGLENLSGLEYLKWLSLRNQQYIDVWCLDRIAGQNGDSLEYLDISSCDLNIGCVGALVKMPHLQTLVIKYPEDLAVLNALAYLEYKTPDLIIKTDRPVTEKEENLEQCQQYVD